MKVEKINFQVFLNQNFKAEKLQKEKSKLIKILSVVPYKITSGFGEQESFRNSPHLGIDFKMKLGEPLRAVESGIIHIRNYGNVNSGKTILIETENGKTFIYGHLSKFANVQEGRQVNVGELIGYAGNSGFSTGSHLHFGVRIGKDYIDPSPYINHIQNMNNPQYFVKISQDTSNLIYESYTISDILNSTNIYQDLIQNLKLNLINFLSSVDYSMFM